MVSVTQKEFGDVANSSLLGRFDFCILISLILAGGNTLIVYVYLLIFPHYIFRACVNMCIM